MFLMARKQIESLYSDRCTITKVKTVQDETTHRSGPSDVTVCTDQPCRLSYTSLNATTDNGNAAKLQQATKLFLAPEISVPAGCKITVVRGGTESHWKCSGLAAVYPDTHQEIPLEPEEIYA